MKFLGFSKIWRQDSKIYFSKKKKFFFGNIFERDFFPDFGENFKISFSSSPMFWQKSFPGGKDFFHLQSLKSKNREIHK